MACFLSCGTISPLVKSLSIAFQKGQLQMQCILTILVVAIFHKNTSLTTNTPFSLLYTPFKHDGTVAN